jgi:hypothetical protein
MCKSDLNQNLVFFSIKFVSKINCFKINSKKLFANLITDVHVLNGSLIPSYYFRTHSVLTIPYEEKTTSLKIKLTLKSMIKIFIQQTPYIQGSYKYLIVFNKCLD